MTEEVRYMVNGRALTEAELRAAAPKRAPRPKAELAPMHRGFRVVGHRLEDLEEARRAYERDHPGKEFSDGNWRRNTKKRFISIRPYELRESANTCAVIAERFGWIDIEVIELRNDQ